MYQVFGFYEELLSTRFPHSSYKLVFVDQAYKEAASYSTLGIFRYISEDFDSLYCRIYYFGGGGGGQG